MRDSVRDLQGIYPATVTPFDESGEYDEAAMRRIVDHQLEAGAHGFYLCGGTGEGLLLRADERQAVLETVVDQVRGRAGIIAHVGAFQTAETVALAAHAGPAGADAVAALPPAYFYKPDAPALVRYYTEVAAATDLPVLIYNIPQRTGIAMTQELLGELLGVDNIVGMKDSSGDLFSLGKFLSGGLRPVIFDGEDTVLLGALLAGACGGIGATYNMMPGLFVDLWNAYQARDMDAAAAVQVRINELIGALSGAGVDLFAGLKQTMAWMGLPCGVPRTPLRPLTAAETAMLRRSLEDAGFFEN